MLTRILALFSVSFIIARATDGVPVLPTGRQFLPALPGYVPVYIRTGDTPLEEINPDLAEAFNNYSLKHARRAFSRSNDAIHNKLHNENAEKESEDLKISSGDISLSGDLESNEAHQRVEVVHNESPHIQKIPRA